MRVLAIAACLLFAHAAKSMAQATQSAVSGRWKAGATSIDVDLDSWGGDCGPRPTSMKSKGGGLVTIEQRDQVLLLHGRDQDIRTDTCWSRNPAMKRNTTSYSNNVWLTRCRTPDADPRAEQGTYTLKYQEPDTLLYKDVSVYDWTLNESKCVATFTTSQTLTRVAGSAVSDKATVAKGGKGRATSTSTSDLSESEAPAPTIAGESGSCIPGDAARIALKPKKAEIELGEKICLKARVSDEADCALPVGNDVIFLLYQPKGLRGSLNGACFTASEDAADGLGEFRVVARRGNIQTDATIEVHRADLSSLIARRMEGSGLSSDDEAEPADAAPKAVARIATRTAPVETSRARSSLSIVLGVTALLLTVLGFWVIRRRPAGSSASVPPPLPRTSTGPNISGGGTMVLGSSASGSSSDRPSRPSNGGPIEPWICPTCRIGYSSQRSVCPKDGATLIPYSEFTKRSRREELEHAKRCPSCGRTYPSSASFCGDDGTNLVSVQ